MIIDMCLIFLKKNFANPAPRQTNKQLCCPVFLCQILFIAAILAAGCSNSDDAFDNPPPLVGYAGAFPVEMVEVPGGNFRLGKELNPGDFRIDIITDPPKVTLTTGFRIGTYQITQWQWQVVMTGNTNGISPNPSAFHGGRGREPAAGENQSKRPVERVSWYDAIVFCNRLSIREGFTPAYRINGSTNPNDWGTVPRRRSAAWDAVEIVPATGYRLPTEAQWEYAAKGGHTSCGEGYSVCNATLAGACCFTFAGSNNPNEVAWYSINNGNITHAVGLKLPNGLGTYDMSGNVREWCWDIFAAYTETDKTDPTGGPPSGSYHITRGGGLNDSYTGIRSVDRGRTGTYTYPFTRSNHTGLRVVRP